MRASEMAPAFFGLRGASRASKSGKHFTRQKVFHKITRSCVRSGRPEICDTHSSSETQMKVLRLRDDKGNIRGLISLSINNRAVLAPLAPADKTQALFPFDGDTPVQLTVRQVAHGREAVLDWGEESFVIKYGSDKNPINLRDPLERTVLCLTSSLRNSRPCFVISPDGCGQVAP